MVKLNPTQTLHVERVRIVRSSLREAKTYSESRARELVTKELAGHQTALDHEVRLAFDAGVPKLQLRRDGLGTMDSKTLEDILKRTEGAAVALAGRLESDPLAHRYSLDGTVLTVTLADLDLERATKGRTWIGKMPDSARFQIVTRADGSQFIGPFEEQAQNDADYNPHPIVSWLNKRENEAEAWAWVEGQMAA
jgi:hypothetical protein